MVHTRLFFCVSLLISIASCAMENGHKETAASNGFDTVCLNFQNSSEDLTLKIQFSEKTLVHTRHSPVVTCNINKTGYYTIHPQKCRTYVKKGGTGSSYYNCYVQLRENDLNFTIHHSNRTTILPVQIPLESIPMIPEAARIWRDDESKVLIRTLARGVVGCKFFYNHHYTIDNQTSHQVL